ncbi:MAG TPA: hypothetical protein PKE00_04610 [Planctomycetota bacterium]|nr:hypothetical protein [Planctomycetota bacterium]
MKCFACLFVLLVPLCASAFVVTTNGARAQDGQKPEDRARASARALEEVHRVLDDERTSVDQRRAKIADFLERFGDAPRDERKKLLVRLATLELQLRQAKPAMQHFRDAEALCRLGVSSDVYVSARCRLGVAQAFGLLGDDKEAMQRYAAIRRDFVGLPFARDAQEALLRLRAKRRLELLKPLVLPPDCVALDGSKVDVAAGRATLFVFVASTSDDGPDGPQLPTALAGLDAKLPLRIVISCPSEDARRWQRAMDKTPLRAQVTVLRDRVDLALGIASLPTWVLVDQRGIVLELNPSLRRLRSIFERD